MFCSKCGKEIDDDAVVCIHCGCATTKLQNNIPPTVAVVITREEKLLTGNYKSKYVFWFLGVCFGFLGFHRFYIESKGVGLIYLLISVLSFGLLAEIIWLLAIIDCFSIRQTKDGKPLI